MSAHTFSTRVLIAGKELPAVSVSWEGEAGNDLPGRLSTSTGLGQRKAKIEWENPQPVSQGRNPWGADYPSPGKKAEIYVTIDGEETKVFTGKVDTTETSVYGKTTSQLVDNSDDLSTVITRQALLRVMPGRNNSGNAELAPDNSAQYMLTQVLAECGYTTAEGSNTAPGDGLVFSAPLQGTMWTDWENNLGALDFSRLSQSSGSSVAPNFVRAGTGDIYLDRGYAQWSRYPNAYWYPASESLIVRARAGIYHTGTADFTIITEIYGNITLRVNNRTLSVLINGKPLAGSASLPAGQTCWVQAEFTSDQIYLTVDDGKATELSYNQKPGNEIIPRFQLEATGTSRISNISVRITKYSPNLFNTGKGISTFFAEKGTAIVDLPSWCLGMDYTPSIRSQKAINFIEDLAQKLCCLVWYDGEGKLHIEYAGYLRDKAHQGVLSIKDMTSAPVETDSLMSASQIRVSSTAGKSARAKSGAGETVTLWQGSGETLAAGETVVLWADVPTEEDWIEVDTSFARWERDNAHINSIKNQSGSVYVTEMAGQWWGDNNFTFETLTPFSFKMTCKSDQNAVALNIPRQVPEIPNFLGGDKTPILRGGARIVQEHQSVAVAKTDASNAAVLEHDMGIYGQGTRARTLAAEVARYCGSAFATYLRSVKHFLKPTIDLGQTWVLDLSEPYGKKFKVLILGVSHNVATDASSLTIRIIEDVTDWSYAELERSQASYDTLESSRASYAALESK